MKGYYKRPEETKAVFDEDGFFKTGDMGRFDEDGHLYITGRPGKRDWYANVAADPRFTLHLKRGVEADLAATAETVADPTVRVTVLRRILTEGFRVDPADAEERLPVWVDRAPLIRFEVAG